MVLTSSRAAADRLQLCRRWLAWQHAARNAAALVGSERGDLEGDGEREAGGDLCSAAAAAAAMGEG